MRNAMRLTTDEPLKCIWMTAGVIDYKLCGLEYDCENCPFDRAIRGSFSHRAEEMPEFSSEIGFNLDGTLFYHPRHIWLRVEEEGRVRVGLDDLGQRLTGRIYSIGLPKPGTSIDRDDGCWRITHAFGETFLTGGARGKVSESNQKLQQLPSLINSDPYGNGWAFVLEPENLLESLKSLYYGKRVKQWYSEEIHKLRRALDEPGAELGVTLQDGGEVRSDLTCSISARIISMFLSAHVPDPAGTGAGAKLERR